MCFMFVLIYLNVCGVCCMLFVSGVWVLLCSVVGMWGGVIFVLSVMRVVGRVPLWLVCAFRHVKGVCVCFRCVCCM